MGILDSATAAVSSVASSASGLVGAGPASALSGVAEAVGGGFTGITSFLSGLLAAKGPKLPLPNPLAAYATYDYILGLGVLTKDDLNNPDTTYRAGKRIPLICKSANSDYSNRILTPYGKFDFFIDNLVLNSTIGMEKGNNTNVSTMTFDIIEPHSMGMFLMSVQTAAQQNGWDNYRDACFLLTIQFRGNKENGTMEIIKDTARQIPIKFTSFNMVVSQTGAKYAVTANAYNQEALTTKNANLKTDVSIKGKTVQEVLQTGEKSLQAVINSKLQQYKKQGVVAVPDEVLILFPNEVASSASGESGEAKENNTGATQSTSASSDDIMKKLGVSYSEINKTLVQPDGVCNTIGSASMGFNADRKADTPMNGADTGYDPATKVNVRGANTYSLEEGNFKFNQNTDIPTAINQVILASSYPDKALDVANITPTGMRQWWRIDTQVYVRESKENLAKTGKYPRLIVYRVIPYESHSSKVTAANAKAPGFEELKKQAVKHYNYLYTGKNTEVLKFDIEFKASLDALMTADSLSGSQDIKTSASQGSSTDEEANKQGLATGNAPSQKLGVTPTTNIPGAIKLPSDRIGGGGQETSSTRAAKVFHDAITYGADMITLNMDIIGDPYWITQSGTGNYTSKPQTTNLNEDGTANWQTGEVDIVVNFRTPIDLNQQTGLYNFGGASKSAPVIQFSGLYYVNTIVSNFKQGKFTQTLTGARRPQQESDATPDAKGMLNVSTDVPTAPTDLGDFYG